MRNMRAMNKQGQELHPKNYNGDYGVWHRQAADIEDYAGGDNVSRFSSTYFRDESLVFKDL